MNKFSLRLGLFACLVFSGCTDKSADVLPDGSNPVQTKAASGSQVTLQWTQEKQVIDGFGIAQAGWTDYLYAHRKREEVMNLLFGADGLHLSILRGEVFPHYWAKEGDTSFYMDEDYNMSLNDPFFDIDFGAELRHPATKYKDYFW